MWFKYTSALLFFVCQACSSVYARELVLAFDDTLAGASSLDGLARTKMLIGGMARADVKQAMFFINTRNLTADTLERMQYYNATGQLIVNAGHKYTLLQRDKNYSLPIEIMKANAALEPYENYHQHVIHPYLNGGGDPTLVRQFQRYLSEHNYHPVYVTTQVHDHYMNRLYQARIASSRSVDIRALEKAYVNMVLDKVLAYDASAYLRLGASPRQVLLLHENDLAAYCIMGLIDALNARGFRVIAPEKVFTDPVVNPYFSANFTSSALNYLLNGLPEAKREWPYLAKHQDQEKVHAYLRAQGLDYLITPEHSL